MATGSSKKRVGVLGCTGAVGQRFIQLLSDNPLFEIGAIGASERSAGRLYADAVNWTLASDIPAAVARMEIRPCRPEDFADCQVIFSGLDASVAGDVESAFVAADFPVFSNARNHRMAADVPLIVPTVNAHHFALIPRQRAARGLSKGFLVCNANCSTTGLAVALKPLHDAYGIESCVVVTMQAISGAGYPGVSAMDITENVIPYISGEEDKLETEPQKILGEVDDERVGFRHAAFAVCASCTRVPVLDGHLENVQVTLRRPATLGELKRCLAEYRCEAQLLNVPSAPTHCIQVLEQPNRPQPRLDRDRGNGFTVSVGRVRPSGLSTADRNDANNAHSSFKFTLLSHNTILGAAGSAIMNAEIALAKGLL